MVICSLKFFLFLAFLSAQTIKPHDFSMNINAAANVGMRATIGCGGAAVGASFGPVGVVCGLAMGGLIGLLVKKCTRRVETKYDRLWFNDSTAQGNKVSTKTVEDIISESEPGEEKRFCKQFVKKGGYKEAMKDFESLGVRDIKDIPSKEGKMGILPDGRQVNVRVDSSDERPTLEILPLNGKGKRIKVITPSQSEGLDDQEQSQGLPIV